MALKVGEPQHHFAVNKSVRRKTRNVVHKEILSTGEVVSTQTEVSLTCSLLNSDQPRGGVEEQRSITPLHFLDLDVISDDQKDAVVRQEEIITQKSKYKFPSSNYC